MVVVVVQHVPVEGPYAVGAALDAAGPGGADRRCSPLPRGPGGPVRPGCCSPTAIGCHGHEPRPDDPLAEPRLAAALTSTGWRLREYEDGGGRFVALAVRGRAGG